MAGVEEIRMVCVLHDIQDVEASRTEAPDKPRKVWRTLDNFCEAAVYLEGDLEMRTDADLKSRMP